MANHKSALKRVKQNAVKSLRNRAVKSRIKTITKQTIAAAEAGEETAKTHLNEATSLITKAAQRGTIHKKAASRKISRLTKLVNKTLA